VPVSNVAAPLALVARLVWIFCWSSSSQAAHLRWIEGAAVPMGAGAAMRRTRSATASASCSSGSSETLTEALRWIDGAAAMSGMPAPIGWRRPLREDSGGARVRAGSE
jgi:hypothetical protein